MAVSSMLFTHLWPYCRATVSDDADGATSGRGLMTYDTTQTQHFRDGDGVIMPGGFWRRIAARLIDLLFATLLAFVLVIPVTLAFLPVAFVLDATGHTDAWGTFGAGVCLFLAFVCMEWLLLVRRQGQTLGKGLMGLRVVRNDNSALSLRSWPAVLRLAILAALVFTQLSVVGWFANLIVVLVDRPRGRAIHDFAASSRVVRAPKRSVNLRADLRMALPVPQAAGVSLTKAAGSPPVNLTKPRPYSPPAGPSPHH